MKKIKIEGFDFVDGGVCAAKGFRANGVQCGLAHKAIGTEQPKELKKKNDLAAIVSDTLCSAAGVYTTNKVKGAPLTVTKNHISNGKAIAVIANSVNANTCNADGVEKAEKMCCILAKNLNISSNDVLVASTGVIGQILPIEPIEKAAPELVKGLSYNGNNAAMEAVMTTDTMPKQVAVKFMIDGKKCTLGGMLKGSGMIHPNMATTLTFLTSDVKISPEYLQKALSEIVKTTLNRVSVDGDMSTNDMAIVLANGMAENNEIVTDGENFEIFKKALYAVMMNLARMMARDGEGATKLIECDVTGAKSVKDAENVAKSVIESNLLKAAMFGEDANWGRILCAVGYADADFDIDKVDVDIESEFGKVAVCENGSGIDFSERKAAEILKSDEITIDVNLNGGDGYAKAWGCDLTYDYVKINGEYRS